MYKINYNPLNNLDIIDLELVKSYDKRNNKLSEHNLVILNGQEQLMTKAKCDEISEHNRVIRNQDLKFIKYLKKAI